MTSSRGETPRVSWIGLACSLLCSVLLVPLIAWGTNLIVPLRAATTSSKAPAWPVEMPNDWPMGDQQIEIVGTQLVRNIHIITVCPDPGRPDMRNFELLDIGVPFRALRSIDQRFVTFTAAGTFSYESVWSKGLRWGTPPNDSMPVRHIIPLRPLPLGFFGNVLVYLGVLESVKAILKTRTKNRRKANGDCSRCGYQLSISVNRCPECGTKRS